ncbi:MAG: chemotaxis protein CheW [Thiobacillus sp.]|nr:chemotaxis protein CheW [Thiobacillus sp.]MDP2977369.1 chemotaxis protein CheW [Thiobacillus sp.]
MASYKGVDVDEGLIDLIGFMDRAEETRESLQSLRSVWDNLTLLGHLSGTATDMSDTRSAFQELSSGLLNQLGCETLKKTTLAMKSKAQVAVDIMIRNLFERTADIGFLAMDDDVREYLEKFAPLKSRVIGEEARLELEQSEASLRTRFREYVQKYSVYANIVLLDVDGNVLLQLDENNPVRSSSDPLIAESLATSQSYVETFRHSDLLPGQAESLIYSYRVTSPNGKGKLGVLCLCFRFANETEGIFANLVGPSDWSVVTLLDRRGVVIASSDQYHVPVGARLEHDLTRSWKVTRFGGRAYLSATRATQGYQGYMGPGWYGHVMLPLEHAFEQEPAREEECIPDSALEAVMRNPRLFSEELRGIPDQAARIQRALNRSVWNGNVSQHGERKALNPAFSKVLLWEISNTGLKTQDVFDQSIRNLHQTVVSSILQDGQFQAALAIDIMDRNLYERANDCRWWALAPVFRRVLSSASKDDAELSAVAETLVHINELYTVYDNLVVFDRGGRVLAVSNPQYQSLCGQVLNEEWVRQTLSLSDSQRYAVSEFAASPLYKGLHTYIYGAAIHSQTAARNVVGGIGIVFDAAPQFSAMLLDALPRDEAGGVPGGCFGVFADRERRVIASTLDELTPGMPLELDGLFFRLGNGEWKSGIAVFNGHYYAVGACMSKGYREYKGADDAYENDVVALIFTPLGERKQDKRRVASPPRARLQSREIKSAGGGECVEIATFYVDSHWLGIPTAHVVEAIDVKGLTRVPGAANGLLGYIMFRDQLIPVVGLWGMLGKEDQRHASREPQIIVMRQAAGSDSLLGVMVDELGEIPEVPLDRIEKVSSMLEGGNGLAESLIKPGTGKDTGEMIVVFSVDRLWRKFMRASECA